MFLSIDRLQVALPRLTKGVPNSGAALQELLGGKFGEISTLNNCFFHSFNFRNKGKLRPFYSPAASITAEEFDQAELVTNGVTPPGGQPGTRPVGRAPRRVTYRPRDAQIRRARASLVARGRG
jgi:Mn-containing catalase